MQSIKKVLISIVQGFIIGIANLIPGVSGGTMMVSMGIYDTIIHCITHIFRQFWKSLKTLLPYILGMALSIFGLAGLLSSLLSGKYALPTYFCFIGMIIGGLRPLLKSIEPKKINAAAVIAFVVMLALAICLGIFGPEKTEIAKDGSYVPTIRTDVLGLILLIPVGAIASATMIIPGVSGSMMMMLMGYYEDIIRALDAVKESVIHLNFTNIMTPLKVLLPFAVGIVLGIFFVAKLIEFLMSRLPTPTYCGVLGLVIASPVAILIKQKALFAALTLSLGLLCAGTFIVGFVLAYLIARMGEKASSPAAS